MSSLPELGVDHRDPWSDPRLVVPSAERWAAMTPTERDREEERILCTLDEYREAMSEGTRHSRPKINAYKDLGDHFARAGRRVFLATELAVLYPGQSVIVPDLLAVTDVADLERERDSWRVSEERRGIDLVLEFRNLGKKQKDIVENVKDYARLGIAEYFSFDCRSPMLRGWRLASPGARTYTPMVPQGGVFPSRVLELELGVTEGRLRFFKDLAQIPTSEELLGRLQKMTDAYQDRLEEAERAQKEAVVRLEEAERAQKEAAVRLEEAERGQREAERAQKEAERGQSETAVRLSAMRSLVAERVLARLAERGLPVTDAQRAQVLACDDERRLFDWLERAAAAPTAEAALSS
jgi:Uma2 family endonuclease